MRATLHVVGVLALVAAATDAAAQATVDQVVERHLTAIGGRAALSKLKSRHATGTIVLLTPAGEFSGSIEVFNEAPNKVRTLIEVDLSAVGAGKAVIDQRFDGRSGYIMDSIQGNRVMSGGQLEALRNGSFPDALMNYKDLGMTAQLSGPEKVGDRDAYVLTIEPPSGPSVRNWIDTETYMTLKAAIKLDVPEMGGTIEQTSLFAAYQDADGIKVPSEIRTSSSLQSYVVTLSKVEHNVAIDPDLFVKPQ